MLGNGWFSQNSTWHGPRQFLVLLSATERDGTKYYFRSTIGDVEVQDERLNGETMETVSSLSVKPLFFVATTGPEKSDNMYKGETYDGRVAKALDGFSLPLPLRGDWIPSISPDVGPTSFGSKLNAHHATNIIETMRSFSPVSISEPKPGSWVFDFSQNMAGQSELWVEHCPAGTVITMQHAEILYSNGLVHDSFCERPKYWLCNLRQFTNYTCNGAKEGETYRMQFISAGFRYVQVTGFPGTPTSSALTAHFVRSNVPQTGEFISSLPLLNSIQHATVYAAMSNQMDIPTDCPQREREGWLGDAQLAFETIQHNFDGGAFYTKWIRDLADVQTFDNRTRAADSAMPDTCPFYSTSAQELEADPGWGIAAWVIPSLFSSYYDDDRIEREFYFHQRSYMEHWIRLAESNNETSGELPQALQHSGDWGCLQPGPVNCAPVEYSQFFYVTALTLQTEAAARLEFKSDFWRYKKLLEKARTLYRNKYFNSVTGCFGNCTDISQILGLTLGILSKEEESNAWQQAVSWFGAEGRYDGRFGGGIVSLKLLYPLLDKFNMSDLGLQFQLHTDQPPSFGYWISQGATTLFEFWTNSEFEFNSGLNSYNHIMYGSTGSWYYSTLAGLQRAPGSRSWRNLIIAPPAAGLFSNLTWVNASIETPMGLVGSSWSSASMDTYRLEATVPTNAVARIIVPVSSSMTVKEGSTVVWAAGAGANIEAIDGVSAAVAQNDGRAVIITVGGGVYCFSVNLG